MTQKKLYSPSQPELSADVHIYKLNDLLIGRYGTEWLEWLPETLWQTIYDEFALNPPRLLRDKILALKAAHTTNLPWVEWDVFENTGEAFNDEIPNFTIMEPLSPGECLTTVTALNRIRKDKYAPEVLIYIANCFFNDGYVYCGIPKVQPHLNELYRSYGHFDEATVNKIKRTFELIWPQRETIEEINDQDLVECQLRKLIQTYTYVTEWRSRGF